MSGKYIIFLVFILLFTAGAQQHWQVVGEMPVPVSGAQAVAGDSLIYIIGGVSDSLEMPLNLIQAYDPATNTWSVQAEMVTGRMGFVADRFGDSEIFMAGGVWTSQFYVFSIEKWNIHSNIPGFTQVHNFDFNFGRVYPRGHIIGDNLFLFGGFASPVINSDSLIFPYIIEYNIPTSTVTFTESASYTANVPYQQMSVRDGNDIYLLGGVFFGLSNEVYRFNAGNRTLELIGNLMGVRAGGQAVLAGQQIYITGGYNELSDALRTTETFDLPTGQSNMSHPLHYQRFDHTAILFDGAIYVFGGRSRFGQTVPFVEKLDIVSGITGTEPQVPKKPELQQNYPNPFNGITKIRFSLPENDRVLLRIYTLQGKLIRTLASGRLPAGSRTVWWDGRDDNGIAAPSGMYVYRLTTSSAQLSKKLLLLR